MARPWAHSWAISCASSSVSSPCTAIPGRRGNRRSRLVLLDRTTRRLRAQGIEVEFTAGAVGFIAGEGFDPEFGARSLRRATQRHVDNELASMVLSRSLNPGDRVVVGADAEAGGLAFEVVEGAGRKEGAVASEAE